MGVTDNPDVGPSKGFDAAAILAILKYYSTHASAIAAVVSALVLILSGDQSAGIKALFEALLAIFTGTAAIGIASSVGTLQAQAAQAQAAKAQAPEKRRVP